MVDLEKLLDLNGAVAAGEFGVGGSLIKYAGHVNEDQARLLSLLCAANTLMARSQADTLSRITAMNFSPLKGWTMSGGDYTVCVMGEIGVIVRTDEADIGEIFRALGEEATIPEPA